MLRGEVGERESGNQSIPETMELHSWAGFLGHRLSPPLALAPEVLAPLGIILDCISLFSHSFSLLPPRSPLYLLPRGLGIRLFLLPDTNQHRS